MHHSQPPRGVDIHGRAAEAEPDMSDLFGKVTGPFSHTSNQQTVHFRRGDGADWLTDELSRLSVSRVLLIGSESALRRADSVIGQIAPAAVFSQVVQHVPVETAEAARAVATDASADVIVTVGGGSATGLGKAVALTHQIPTIAVPTTLAGSEATDVWGLTDGGTKRTGSDPSVLPHAVIYDSTIIDSIPHGLLVASAFNSVAHCVDTFWGPRADPINAAAATEALGAFARALTSLGQGQSGNGLELSYAAYSAAAAFSSAGSGLHHKICHTLGGRFNLPHAQTHTVILPYVLAFNGPAAPEASVRMSSAWGSSDPLASLVDVKRSLGADNALVDIGFDPADIDTAVELCLQAVPESNPRQIDYDDMHALLTAAAHGDDPVAFRNSLRQQSPDAPGSPSTFDSAAQETVELDLIDRVLRSFEDTPDPRLKYLLTTLTEHIHSFVRTVRLTEDEWQKAIDFLTRAGDITTATRQEFVLLSDVFGASMQTIAVNNPAVANATEATVFGPFFVEDAPRIDQGGDISGPASGEPCWVHGRVTDTHGNPLPGARIEVWEADDDGFYDVQYDDGRVGGRAHLFSDDEGRYRFWGVKPTPYPIPNDGPVGAMLEAVGRSPYRAAHLHFMVSHDSARTLVTHIFVAGDELLGSDSVFGVKDSLVKDFNRHDGTEPTPDGSDVGGRDWFDVTFDIVLAPRGL